MLGQKLIRFVQHNLPYMAGEVAHFPEDKADELVSKGVAVPHESEAKAEPEAKPAKARKPEAAS